jgi:hypothetical protein
MNTGIQYTTEWEYTRVLGGISSVETCRLVKSLNGNMTTFYTNAEAANLTTAQYQDAFNNTLTYMASKGWTEFPSFDESCRTNIAECPIIPPNKYTVLPMAFVCQDSMLAVLPTRLTGVKLASTFQYLIDGVPSGNVRLVKSLIATSLSATFYPDSEISQLGEGIMYGETYSEALNRTMQYMVGLGWLATPDINACQVYDIVACPVKKAAKIIDIVNIDAEVEDYIFTSNQVSSIKLTAGVNSNSGQTRISAELTTGMAVLTNVIYESNTTNIITFRIDGITDDSLNITMNYDYGGFEDVEREADENGVTFKLNISSEDIEKMILTNNGVKTLNLSVLFEMIR